MIIDSRYKVLDELGTGLWATVYRVRDIRTDRIFALKLFHKLDPGSLYEKFSAEQMHHITKIRHPNLVRVIDFGNFGSHIYHLSEYYEANSLKDFRLKAVNLDLLYDIIVQICYGLNAIHSQNIIHQNLKPENVLYSISGDQPQVKIMDYGFTKIDFTKSQQKVSSNLPYIAPEIYLDQKTVPQSDFYSLGVILYKITTGILPYTIEQISGFMNGNRYNLFPKFPRELNREIPDGLEKLILKLLERNPEARFDNVEEVIEYINRIQIKDYSFSQSWSIVNNIKFSDYIVREDYAHQLLEYVPLIRQGNGKVIVVTAGKGLGKTNILTLFRYHLLTDDFFIFDYECSPNHKDPFFALIKEFYYSVENNQKLVQDLSRISSKLKEYIFESEETAAMRVQNEEELSLDFQTSAQFLVHLSEIKPLIFTIRSGQYLGKEVIDFVNYIHNELTRHQILIIFSINDPRKIEGLIHAIKIKIEALNLNQTREYVHKLLKIIPPDDFSVKLWGRSNGNPLFIEQILIDLTQNRKIWKSNQFRFDFDLDKYQIPEEILHLIYLRMAHLSESSYRYLQKLAFVNTPLSKNLIKHILKISEKEVFFLIKDGTDNEILAKRDGYYHFTFNEAVERFQQESTKESKTKVSQRLLQYFDKQTISQIPIVKGIIKHATEIEDLPELKKFKLILVKLYFDRGERDKAFDEMVEVVELNFTGKMPVSPVDMRQDLINLIDMSEWATSTRIPVRLKKNVIAMPDISEKHLLIAIFYMSLEKYSLAQCRLERALSLSITGKQRIYILLKLAEIYTATGDTDSLGKTIKELEQYQLTNELKISFISLKGLYLGITGSLQEGIQLIEDYIPAIETQNNDNFFIKLGTIHNTLAYLYHQRKVLDEADRNFQIARKNWEKVNYQRKLSTVYNNIGDVALVQGYTWEALDYFKKALVICKTIDCKKNYVLSLLNHGETYIKLGEFKKAEEYLLSAQKRSVNFENKPFLSSIIYNLAIAKSKLYNFGYYYNFISENAPEILAGKIDQITPMTKNYFYYLYNIGDYQKIDQLLGKIRQLCLNCNQQEFYYQILGFITLKKKDFSNALKHLELAFKYSQENRSIYAQAINYIRLAEFYLEIGDTNKAMEILLQSKMISEQNSYNYWIRVIDLRMIRAQLREGSVSLRLLIRQLLEIRDYVQENNLFHLEIECYEMLIQIYSFLKIKQQAAMYHKLYRERIKDAVLDIPQHDRSLYFKKTSYGTSELNSFKTLEINVKKYRELENWEEELYDILKLKDNSRIRFFLDRTIRNLLSPDFYAILLVEDITGKKEPFLHNNTEYRRLYSSKYQERVVNSIEDNKIIARKMDGSNILFVPLRIKGAKVGCLVLADKGELKFQENELKVISNLKLHLSSILIRIKEFSDLNDEMKLMTKLVEMNQKFFSVLNLDKIEQDLVAFALDFIGGSRGFLIKKDKYQNYVYKIALDDSKHLIKNFSNVSKTLLSEVQKTGEPIYIENIKDNQSLNVYQNLRGETFSAYCAPIIINKEIYGFLYIDNYNSTENRININPEFIRLLLIQIGVAITNALHYELLMKKNHEISSLEQLKNNFINIVSHELKTPLVTLQGYINRMLKFKIPKRDLKIVQQVEKSVDRLYLVTNDIINHNKFIMLKKIDKSLVSIQDIMEIVADEIKTISKERHMQIKLEIEPALPLISVNWEAIQLMLNNVVLNAVRFTRDFGTIIIGARRSAFQQEEVNQQESLLIYIQDNGIGIPEEEQTKIFQKFYEINKIYSHSSGIVEFKSSGLGLGLATVKLIVDLHDGKIWIHSKEKEGTTVFIALPVVKHDVKED